MYTIREYVMPETLEQADQLLKAKKANCIVGGCAWLRLGNKRIQTAIDLSKLNLDYIREENDFIEIGAMTSYRSVETSDILKNNFNGTLATCISSIIGTQFRNTVTVGGSVYGRFGFSDFLTPLLTLDTYVTIVGRGDVPLKIFMEEPYQKCLIEKIRIRKDNRKAKYLEFRNERADFPMLNLAASMKPDGLVTVTVGARGPKAVIAEKTSAYLTEELKKGTDPETACEKAGEILVEEVTFTSNMRASAEYRKVLAKVLLKRAVKEVASC